MLWQDEARPPLTLVRTQLWLRAVDCYITLNLSCAVATHCQHIFLLVSGVGGGHLHEDEGCWVWSQKADQLNGDDPSTVSVSHIWHSFISSYSALVINSLCFCQMLIMFACWIPHKVAAPHFFSSQSLGCCKSSFIINSKFSKMLQLFSHSQSSSVYLDVGVCVCCYLEVKGAESKTTHWLDHLFPPHWVRPHWSTSQQVTVTAFHSVMHRHRKWATHTHAHTQRKLRECTRWSRPCHNKICVSYTGMITC